MFLLGSDCSTGDAFSLRSLVDTERNGGKSKSTQLQTDTETVDGTEIALLASFGSTIALLVPYSFD